MSGRAPSMTEDLKKVAKFAAKAGAVLALVCHLLPPHYRPICDAISSLCTGGN